MAAVYDIHDIYNILNSCIPNQTPNNGCLVRWLLVIPFHFFAILSWRRNQASFSRFWFAIVVRFQFSALVFSVIRRIVYRISHGIMNSPLSFNLSIKRMNFLGQEYIMKNSSNSIRSKKLSFVFLYSFSLFRSQFSHFRNSRLCIHEIQCRCAHKMRETMIRTQ